DEHTQRQVQPDGLLALHQRRARREISGDQYFGWPQAQSDLLRFSGMVDLWEEGDFLFLEEGLLALDCLGGAVRTWQRHKASVGGGSRVHFLCSFSLVRAFSSRATP